MERQDKWRQALPKMCEIQYRYDGHLYTVDNFKIIDDASMVLIYTNVRTRQFSFESMPTVLPLWRPVTDGAYDPALPIPDEPVNDNLTITKIENNLPDKLVNPAPDEITPLDQLKSYSIKLFEDQERVAGEATEMLLDAMKKLKTTPTYTNQAKQQSNAAAQIAKIEANKLIALRLAKEVIMSKKTTEEDQEPLK